MTETPAEARLRRKIEGSWPGHGPCGWLVYSPERKHPSAIYDLEVTARSIAEHHGLECVAVVPTLTDEEREAVEDMAHWCEVDSGYCREADEQRAADHYAARAATLRGLLERTRAT